MRFGDFLWSALLVGIVVFLFYPVTHGLVMSVTKSHPYVMGFIKFAILATMGELLAIRIVIGEWRPPQGLVYRLIVWGFIGVAIVVIFGVFSNGVIHMIKEGLLPVGRGGSSNITTALWISIIMNLAWAPTLMLFHKITDTCIDLAHGQATNLPSVKLVQVVNAIDWKSFIDFILVKTILLFWIPAHTITFLLAPEYRVLYAAFLSIALGGILGFAKSRVTKEEMIVFE